MEDCIKSEWHNDTHKLKIEFIRNQSLSNENLVKMTISTEINKEVVKSKESYQIIFNEDVKVIYKDFKDIPSWVVCRTLDSLTDEILISVFGSNWELFKNVTFFTSKRSDSMKTMSLEEQFNYIDNKENNDDEVG